MPIAALLNLPEWWSNFDLTVQIFYGIALMAGLVVTILLLMALIGLDHEHLTSVGDSADVDDGTTLLSLKPILGFLLGFGWAGGALRSEGYSTIVSCLGALSAGVLAMGAIYLLIRSTSKMRSDGTLKRENAIGQIGTVYIDILADSAPGGQITVSVGDRMIVLQATHSGPITLRSGTKVKVLEFIGTDTVRVSAVK